MSVVTRLMACVVACASQTAAGEPPALDAALRLFASPTTVWIAYRPPLAGEAATGEVFLLALNPAALDRRPVVLPPRRGEIRIAAAGPHQLFAFFTDGTLAHIGTDQSRLGRPLPGSAVPAALAFDADRQRLVALIDSPTAAHVPGGEQPTGTPCLAAYDLRDWSVLDCSVPAMGDVAQWWSAAVDGQVALLARDSQGHLFWALFDRQEWRGPWPIRGEAAVEPLAVSLRRDSALLVVARKAPRGGAAQAAALVLLVASEGSVEEVPLERADEPVGGSRSYPLAVAIAGGQVVAARSRSAGQIDMASWDLAGRRLQEWMPLGFSIGGRSDLARRVGWYLNWGSSVLLVGILLVVFWARQGEILAPAELPLGLEVAGLARRALGFCLDFAPVAVVTIPLWGPPLLRLEEDLQAGMGARVSVAEFWLRAWIPSAIVRAAYVGYCLAWELATRTTPGKAATGARVVGTDGLASTAAQIVSRNLLRFIELEPTLHVWPLALLMVLTRKRQRLGDLWARTVVAVGQSPTGP